MVVNCSMRNKLIATILGVLYIHNIIIHLCIIQVNSLIQANCVEIKEMNVKIVWAFQIFLVWPLRKMLIYIFFQEVWMLKFSAYSQPLHNSHHQDNISWSLGRGGY